jgi:hypothetical protein
VGGFGNYANEKRCFECVSVGNWRGQLVLFRSYYEDGSCVLGPKTLTLSDKSLSIVG